MIPKPVPAQEPNSKMRLRLWLRLLKLTGNVETELRRRMRDENEITLPRFDVMAALSRYPDGLKMSELSGYLRVSNGNVTGIVDRLTEDGLALRVAVKGDRRAQLARLTPAGHAVFAGHAAAHEGWVDELLSGFEPAQVEAMLQLLNKMPVRKGRTDAS